MGGKMKKTSWASAPFPPISSQLRCKQESDELVAAVLAALPVIPSLMEQTALLPEPQQTLPPRL